MDIDRAMTQEEAEAQAARLTRIWKPETPFEVGKTDGGDDELALKCCFASFSEELELDVYLSAGGSPRAIFLTRWHEGKQDRGFGLEIGENNGWEFEDIEMGSDEMKILPFFRRCCWLSGCPIESSAHEKAEWMREFTPEEIQTWQLRF